MKKIPILALTFFLLLFFPLLGESLKKVDAPQEKPEAASDDKLEKQMFSVLEKVKKQVEKLRGLKFKSEVKGGVLTKEQLRVALRELMQKEIPDEEIEAYEEVYRKFGLIYPKTDLKKVIEEMYTEGIAGLYDPHSKEMKLIKEPALQGPARVQRQMLEIVLAHELTHALQDQHFDLLSMPYRTEKHNDDFALATQALIEGDATLLMLDYMRPGEASVADIPNLDKSFAMLLAAGTRSVSPDTPKILVENMIFPYMRGLNFVMKGKGGASWKKIDGMFFDPPTSTEQVLHPEKYFGVRDYPLLIKLPDLSAILGDGWRLILDNNMGELNVGVLLSEFILGDEAETSAQGWDGDRFVGYRSASGNKIFLAWYTTWDTQKDAEEFIESMRKYIQNRYRDDTLVDSEAKNFYLWQTSAGFVKVFKKGKDVILIDGAEEEKIKPLEDALLTSARMREFRYTRKKKEGVVTKSKQPASDR